MPRPTEIAVVEVNGKKFDDWETVYVQRVWRDSYAYFRFTAAERDPIFLLSAFPLSSRLQFKPGDECTITLAGQLAATGFIETRQVAYDANQHGVMLIGKGVTAWAARSSVDTKTGNFDKKNIVQAAKEVLAPHPVGVKVIGQVDMTPFDKIQSEAGEMIWDFLERLSRMRGVILGSDNQNNFLLIGKHSMPVGGNIELVEGRNIKSCQCTITHEKTWKQFDGRGQTSASDDNAGTKASEQHATVQGEIQKPYSILITALEHPVKSDGEVQKRTQTIQQWNDGTIVRANITVQGWLMSSGKLWEPGLDVPVYSPMAMLNQALKIRTATFTQDNNNGTQTLLDMVLPSLLNGEKSFDSREPSKTDATPKPNEVISA